LSENHYLSFNVWSGNHNSLP